MPPSILRAVIFDLGGTLMYERDAAYSVNARGDEALTRYLQEQGLELNLSTFPVEFRRRLEEYFKQREKDLLETAYVFALRDILTNKGYAKVSDQILREALDRLFAVTQTNWILEEDALQTLKKIGEDGYRIGLLSNAGDDQDVQQLLRKFGIGRFFDFALTSAACGYRKPHAHIFELALSNWRFLPSETAMIGDNLNADIHGAKNAGLRAIWIKRRADSREATQPQSLPDAVVSTLAEIPAALDRLQIR